MPPSYGWNWDPPVSFFGGRYILSYNQRPGGPRQDAQQRALSLIKTLSLEDFPVSSPLITSSGEVLPLSRAAEVGKTE